MNSFFKSTNMWLMSAGLLSIAVSGLHVFGGTPEIMDPLYASTAPALSKGIAAVMWNQITLLCILAGAILGLAAVRPSVAFELSLTTIALYLGIAVLFVISGIYRFGDLWTMPQWTLFSFIAALAVIGLLRNKKTASN